jgi:hypothetical protein
MYQERHGIFSIVAMVRGYHIYKSIWTLPLVKSSEPWQRTDTETLLAPAAMLATACGIGQRSCMLENFFARFKLLFFIFA